MIVKDAFTAILNSAYYAKNQKNKTEHYIVWQHKSKVVKFNDEN